MTRLGHEQLRAARTSDSLEPSYGYTSARMEGVRRKVLWVLRISDLSSLRLAFNNPLNTRFILLALGMIRLRRQLYDLACERPFEISFVCFVDRSQRPPTIMSFRESSSLVEHRDGLPIAPACQVCNSKRSKLETYLTAVLPMASRLENCLDRLQEVRRRFAGNQKLTRELLDPEAHRGRVWSDGLVGIQTGWPLREGQIESYLAEVTKGLAWFHWGVPASAERQALAITMHRPDQHLFDQFLNMGCRRRIDQDWGEGTIRYSAIEGIEDRHLSIWIYELFGGLTVGNASDEPDQHSSRFTVFLGHEDFIKEVIEPIACQTADSAPAAI